MRTIGTFDVTQGAFPVPCGGREATATLVLKNLSGYELTIRAGGLSDIIGAHTYERIDVGSLVSWDGNLQVTPQALASNTSQAPSQVLIVTAYAPGEPVSGFYPMAIDRLSNVGNQIAVTSVDSLKNDGNAPGTPILESTPSDQGSSAFNLANDGSGLWQVLSAGVQRIVAQVIRGNAIAGKASIVLGDAGDTSILTLHGTADNATSAVNVGDGGAGGYLTAVDTATNTDLRPTQNRMLSLSMRDTGGVLHQVFSTSGSGATVFISSTGVQFSGHFTQYNGQVVVGLGVPLIVAQAVATPVSNSTPVQIVSWTPSGLSLVRVSGHVFLTNNGGTAHPTLTLAYHDGNFNAVQTIALSIIGSGNNATLGPTQLTGSNNVTASLSGSFYSIVPVVVYVNSSSALTVTYTEAGTGFSDNVSCVVERLS